MVTVNDIEPRIVVGWKGIQQFFGGQISLRVLKKWADDEAMPIFRDGKHSNSRVYADANDLLDWQIHRKSRGIKADKG